MDNPLDMWKGLGKNGKIALIAGLIIVSAYLYYHSKKKTAATVGAPSDSTTANQASSSSETGDTTPSGSNGYQSNGYIPDSMNPAVSDVPIESGYGLSAYGSSSGGVGGYVGTGGGGAGTVTGTTQPPSATPPAPVDVTINNPAPGGSSTGGAGTTTSPPSASTGGGAPSTPAANAHLAKNAPQPSLSPGAIRAPYGPHKPPPRAGYTIKGQGHGYWEYVPIKKPKK